MKESIAGLAKDSSVKFRGVDIGRVKQIRINPKNIEVIEILLDIQKEIPIKEDMRASTQMLGVTGLLSIEIDGGTNEARILEPTLSYIPLIKTKSSLFSTLKSNLESMSEKLDIILSQSQKLLSDKNIKNIEMILTNVETVSKKSEEVEDKAIMVMNETNITLAAFRVSMRSINEKFIEATQDFSQMQKNFLEIKKVTVPTIEKIMQTSKNFNRMTRKVERSLDRGDYNFKKILEPMLIDIHVLLTQLNSMTKELEESPSNIFFKSRKSRRGPGE
jgi:phospholipid/cholesterol/gamma-HCH transport system substrate-binding protein